jgi:hypothetical protein
MNARRSIIRLSRRRGRGDPIPPHQSTNDVGFRSFFTCSIAACDNHGGGAPEAVVIPPSNSAYTRQSKIPPDDRSPAAQTNGGGHVAPRRRGAT